MKQLIDKQESNRECQISAQWVQFLMRRPLRRSSEQGLTIMECLVAILVIAVSGVMITPPLFMAAATRVQNRRAEQAMQLAQGQIDRVRTLVEQGRHYETALPAAVPAGTVDLQLYPHPTTVANAIKSVDTSCDNLHDGSTVPANTLLPVDLDGDCEADFLLQFFRTPGTFSSAETGVSNGRPTSFNVGVRVYAINALENVNSGNLYVDDGKVVPASLKFTSGEGNQRDRPLAALYSQITWGDSSSSLCQYHGTCPE